jgi:hypothetical protein
LSIWWLLVGVGVVNMEALVAPVVSARVQVYL